MTETRLALSKLGWTDELIDAFLTNTAQQIPDGVEEPDLSVTVDTTDMTLSDDESLICSGTAIPLIEVDQRPRPWLALGRRA